MIRPRLTIRGACITIAMIALTCALLAEVCRWGRANAREAEFLESKGCVCKTFTKGDWRSKIASLIPWAGEHWNKGEIYVVCAGSAIDYHRPATGMPSFRYHRSPKFFDENRAAYAKLRGRVNLAWLNQVDIAWSLDMIDFESVEIEGDALTQSYDRIEHLLLNGCRSIDGGIGKLLRACSNVVQLELRYATLDGDDIEAIGSLRNLEDLELTGSNVDDRILAVLPNLPKLHTVELSVTQITDFDPKSLEEHDPIWIRLEDTPLSQAARERLWGLPFRDGATYTFGRPINLDVSVDSKGIHVIQKPQHGK